MKKILTLACVCGLALAISCAASAAPSFSSNLNTVTIDGRAEAAGSCVSVLYDSNSSTYNMWYRTSQGTIDGLQHATSTDGLAFTSQGSLSFSNTPFEADKAAPYLYYENVAKVGNDYKIFHWTYNGGAGGYSAYDYNISVSDIGTDPNNLSVTHQGAISGGTAGQTAGSFGNVGDYLYCQGGTGRQLTRSTYDDTTTSIAGPYLDVVLDAQSLFDSLGYDNGYINNHSDVISMGSELGFFFTLRSDFNGTRADQQVYFASSADNGATWSSISGLFSNPLLNGSVPGGAFAHADAVNNGADTYLYLSTQDATGNYVIARASTLAPVPEPGTILAALSILGPAGVMFRRRRA